MTRPGIALQAYNNNLRNIREVEYFAIDEITNRERFEDKGKESLIVSLT